MKQSIYPYPYEDSLCSRVRHSWAALMERRWMRAWKALQGVEWIE